MSKPYSPYAHPHQIKEQISDKQYLELYNAAQWCFNLTPNWAATVPLPPGAVTLLPRAEAVVVAEALSAGALSAPAISALISSGVISAATISAATTTITGATGAAGAGAAAAAVATAAEAEAEAAVTSAAVAVDRSRSTAAAAAPAASDAGTGGSAALVPSPPQPRCTGVTEIAHEIEQSSALDGPADPQGFRARWTEVCHRRRKQGSREVTAHE